MNYREIAQAYIKCARRSSVDGQAETCLDSIELAPGQRMRLGLMVCRWAREFGESLERAAALLGTGEYTGWEMVGHNAWLSQVGYGTGFWDRGLGELGDTLSDASKLMGESAHGYIGDDGFVYFDGFVTGFEALRR